MFPSKILVPVDFSPSSDAALDYALTVADACGAEVEMLYVWRPREHGGDNGSAIFADTPEGLEMERRLSAAESVHAARLSGRLEFGAEPALVILALLERERFDMVVVGPATAPDVVKGAPCKCEVVTVPPPPPDETEAA